MRLLFGKWNHTGMWNWRSFPVKEMIPEVIYYNLKQHNIVQHNQCSSSYKIFICFDKIFFLYFSMIYNTISLWIVFGWYFEQELYPFQKIQLKFAILQNYEGGKDLLGTSESDFISLGFRDWSLWDLEILFSNFRMSGFKFLQFETSGFQVFKTRITESWPLRPSPPPTTPHPPQLSIQYFHVWYHLNILRVDVI